jgi:hypothetical protein
MIDYIYYEFKLLKIKMIDEFENSVLLLKSDRIVKIEELDSIPKPLLMCLLNANFKIQVQSYIMQKSYYLKEKFRRENMAGEFLYEQQ